MSEHTKGRLVSHPDFPGYIIPADQSERPIGGAVDAGTDRNYYANIVATVSVKYHDYVENARRLAAAWNVCEGIDTESLETGATLADICERYNGYQQELNAARALLREVLKADDDAIAELSALGLPPDGAFALTDRIRNYLDACDTLEGK